MIPPEIGINLMFHLTNYKENIAKQVSYPPFQLILPALMLVTAEMEPPGWRLTESMFTMGERGGNNISHAIEQMASNLGYLNPNLVAVITGVMGGYRPVEKEESRLLMQSVSADELRKEDLRAGLLINAVSQEGQHICSVIPIFRNATGFTLGPEEEGYTYEPKETEGETPAHLFWATFLANLNETRPGPEGGIWN